MTAAVDYFVAGPPFTVQFSPVDQVTPPIYSRRVLIFSRESDENDAAVRALRDGLQRTINEFPILAGQMGYSPSGWTIKPANARLRIKEVPLKFSILASNNFSESMLPADLVSSVPTLADPETEWHSCRIQANFVRGGLLLVISIHHTTMDGHGITKVIKSLARNCHLADAIADTKPVHIDRSGYFRSSGNADPGRLGSYTIVTGTPNLTPAASGIVTRSFRFSDLELKALKLAASPRDGWITTHDAVNALCWKNHALGRFKNGIISEDDIARFAFPVEFRKLLCPPLKEDYVGNAVLMMRVELPVRILLGQDGLVKAATAIRNGIKTVDREYVDNFIAIAESLEIPGQLKINLKLTEPATAFGSTTYKSFPHSDLMWDSAIGKYERLRLTSGVIGEGMSIILPVLSDGSWEVTVSVVDELWDLFETAEEWTKYTSRN